MSLTDVGSLVNLGTFILWYYFTSGSLSRPRLTTLFRFGWLGFNGGSAFGEDPWITLALTTAPFTGG
jgi:hypothetical protein